MWFMSCSVWTHQLVVSNVRKFNRLGRGTRVASGQCNHLSMVATVHLDLHLWRCIHECVHTSTTQSCKPLLSHTDGVSCKVKRWWLGEYSITVLLQTLQLVQNEPVFLCTASGSDLLAQKKKELDCKCMSMSLLLNNNYKIVASLT